jgi:hypothetical protein
MPDVTKAESEHATKAFDRLFKVIVARDDQAKRAEGMVVQQTSLIGVLLLFAVRVNFDLCAMMHSQKPEKMRSFHECGIGQEQEHSGPARIFSGEESFGQPETGPLGSILDLQWPFLPKKDRFLNGSMWKPTLG